MLKHPITQTNAAIGIDIHQKFVCTVELTKFGSTYTVKNCIYNTDINNINLAAKPVITGLAHKDIYFQEIQLQQKLTAIKLEKFLQLNIGKYLKHPVKDLIFDYAIIKNSSETTGTTVQLIAASNAVIQKHVNLFKQHNIFHKIIDLNIYALERVTRRQAPISDNIVAAINIDLDNLLIIVINKYKILYTHAEFIENINEHELTIKLITVLRNIPHKIDRIFLAGQQNIESNILTIIINNFNLEAKKINSFIGMKLPNNFDHKITPALAISCGLALRVNDVRWH